MARLVSRAMGYSMYWSGVMLRCSSVVYWSFVVLWSLVVDWSSMVRSGFVVSWSCVMSRSCMVNRSCVVSWSIVMDWSCVFFMGSNTMLMSKLKRALVVFRSFVMGWFAFLLS